ncbi:MAG: hypothetical protein OXM01_06760 [Gemmatimonadota bacterium]|nr:hypothetical protein [Gemmatimonadota bacterium]
MPQEIKALLLLGGAAFVIVLFLGMTKRVVIFQDIADFGWSVALAVVPSLTFIVAAIMAPADAPPGHNALWSDGYGKTITLLGSLTFTFVGVKVLTYSVASNGRFLGAVVFLFKVAASIIFLALVVGFFFRDKKEGSSDIGELAGKSIGVAIFGWFLKRLINGAQVEEHRIAMREG